MNTLNQRYGLNFKKFEILDNGVKVSDRYLWNYFECALSFEEILNKEIISTNKKGGWLVVFFVFLIVSIILGIVQIYYSTDDKWAILFWIGMAIISLAIFLFNKKDFRIIQGLNSANLVFFNNRPDKETLDNFIKEIFEKRRSFFLNKYVSDSFEQDEKLRSLNWLYEKEIIDLDEFNKQKKKLSSGSMGGF
ncbi:MAG: hypothetical protein A2921_03110 [Candidatus Magasanikbacteria bacterium RIFCSPLOWO2_01_FULL_43_20b]|uniref:SHOCT domain-containing protein n=1 Tax=Candidatus Magasanikbacteria bacterium RIFCSPLOWO2_12_FULL_43_12 TaxID=1798692 RepID=A0A1F6MW67_9BACT|nr:MAG: hypothetical protein A3C74_04415 [Candidatus Magasanikbacteria bacterium RIFCSPHIGHO2_02_FULL_44_13]OGH71874.1 MAG: hypothetical protein A3I93_01955 [Candidatus Magasanikbacteria bacterium RIFCSPLOWO2_02_FULL_43_22]OGH72853.1 MAG: hypothetical protein A2921_03110 [Candidatus Magasanikbacteria bacterium RIFCSPLOWO2_01_FULL_43_20b]OGH75740.1 MAG: hypothetical protein A3G00_03285 [Candidatus Magasanikbacteria bacterium RIFCSPLOWO2_12_FULL_43_12]